MATTSTVPLLSAVNTARQQADTLRFHTSPPPSLTARFNLTNVNATSVSMTGEDDSHDSMDRRTLPGELKDPKGTLQRFIDHLLSSEHADSDPNLMAIGYELEALLAIYGPDSVKLSIQSRPSSFHPDYPKPTKPSPRGTTRDSVMWDAAMLDEEIGFSPGERIRYEVSLPIWEADEVLEGVEKAAMPDQSPSMRVMVSLPPTYPNTSPPQLQLLGRYLGNFSIDTDLFGTITRTFISSAGVSFTPGDVCVFEGLVHVQYLAKKWYAARLSTGLEGEKLRRADKASQASHTHGTDYLSKASPFDSSHIQSQLAQLDLNHDEYAEQLTPPRRPGPRETFSYGEDGEGDDQLPEGLQIISCEPIVERRSAFQGHAVRVTSEKQVPLVIHELLSDKKIAKAAHPAIFAYRIAKEVGGAAGKVISSDCDDDGESAAGGRLAHLLEILDIENVLVVVSRWYGGTLLGPDRFKLINQAARDALDKAGFLDDDKPDNRPNRRRK